MRRNQMRSDSKVSIALTVMRLRADMAMFVNLTLPIRFDYAVNCALRNLAYDEIANDHYQEEPSALWRLRIAFGGFIEGLTQPIPDYFIEGWFYEAQERLDQHDAQVL